MFSRTINNHRHEQFPERFQARTAFDKGSKRGAKSLFRGVYQKAGEHISEDVVRLTSLEEDEGLQLSAIKSEGNKDGSDR